MKGSAAQVTKAKEVIALMKLQLNGLKMPSQVPSEDAGLDSDDFFFDDDEMRDVSEDELVAFQRISHRLINADSAPFILDYLSASPVPLLQSLCHSAKFAKWDQGRMSIQDSKVADLVGLDDLKRAETLIHALI